MRNILDQEGTSGRGKSLGARLAMSVAAIAAAVVLLGLGAAAFATPAHAQVGGATYSGSFQEDDGTGCGGGTIDLTLNDDGTQIVSTLVDGAMFGGVPIDDLAVDIDPPVEIADDGSFSATFDAVPGIPITLSGSFDGDSVSGDVDVPALSCNATFTATTAGDGMDDGDDDGMDDGDDDGMDDGADAEVVTSMPSTGSGPAGMTNSQTTIWLALAAALAAVGFASIGVAQRLKRSVRTLRNGYTSRAVSLRTC